MATAVYAAAALCARVCSCKSSPSLVASQRAPSEGRKRAALIAASEGRMRTSTTSGERRSRSSAPERQPKYAAPALSSAAAVVTCSAEYRPCSCVHASADDGSDVPMRTRHRRGGAAAAQWGREGSASVSERRRRRREAGKASSRGSAPAHAGESVSAPRGGAAGWPPRMGTRSRRGCPAAEPVHSRYRVAVRASYWAARGAEGTSRRSACTGCSSGRRRVTSSAAVAERERSTA